jgi:hypothetical protein
VLRFAHVRTRRFAWLEIEWSLRFTPGCLPERLQSVKHGSYSPQASLQSGGVSKPPSAAYRLH